MSAVRKVAGRVDALRYILSEHVRRGAFERILGLELFVPPTVLSPSRFRTGTLLARAVAAALEPGDRVLDMGAGSGLVAIEAARRGARAVAVDINPAAVRATLVNAMLNGVEVDARWGDLFQPLDPRSRFAVIAFNPPFFESDVPGPLSLALSGRTGLPALERFCAGCHGHLEQGGRLLIAGSTNGALCRMREIYRAHGFRWRTVRTRERISERLVIDRLER